VAWVFLEMPLNCPASARPPFAAVGSPDRRYLWVLARSSAMPGSTYRQILEEVRAKAFDVERLSLTVPFVAE
jgi:lipocalin